MNRRTLSAGGPRAEVAVQRQADQAAASAAVVVVADAVAVEAPHPAAQVVAPNGAAAAAEAAYATTHYVADRTAASGNTAPSSPYNRAITTPRWSSE